MVMKRFINNCIRVLKITKKPDKEEFVDLVKITGLGILAVGVIGFIIQMITNLIG